MEKLLNHRIGRDRTLAEIFVIPYEPITLARPMKLFPNTLELTPRVASIPSSDYLADLLCGHRSVQAALRKSLGDVDFRNLRNYSLGRKTTEATRERLLVLLHDQETLELVAEHCRRPEQSGPTQLLQMAEGTMLLLVTAPVIFGVIINATYVGLIFVISLYFQVVMGYSTAQSGLAFIPLTATFVVANLLSGKLVGRFGPRVPLITGASIAALGYALLISLGPESSFLMMLPGFILVPAGMGMTVPTLSTAVMSSVEANLAGTAIAALNTARQIGAAAGVAIFGSLVATGSAGDILNALQITTISSAILLLIAMAMAYQVHYPEFGATSASKA